jgi:serine/threonine-protein kinase HipA
MTKILDVYFYGKIIGLLEQDAHGDMSFTYSVGWLNDPGAIRISCSLPLQAGEFKRKECQAFFGGILPEDTQRRLIAKNLGISVNNDFSMLEKIGGECAGALSFISHEKNLNSPIDAYQKLDGAALANTLRELPSRPLLAGDNNIRLSLAGVQDKLAVYFDGEKISIPLNNAPSTHILKPDFNLYEGVIFNEAFCMKLAKQIGLSVAEVEIKNIEDINYLLVKRYDRIIKDVPAPGIIKRVHQEDFCQALGIPSVNKYQNEGGPSLKQCFDLIRRESSIPVLDLEKMLSAVIFDFLIGNCDAHGKNFSLLYLDALQLTPLYDLISTIYYKDLSKKMAMKLGGEYVINNVKPTNFDKLAEDIGFAKPEIRKRIIEIADVILASLPSIALHHQVQAEVSNLIKTRCLDFISLLKKAKNN